MIGEINGARIPCQHSCTPGCEPHTQRMGRVRLTHYLPLNSSSPAPRFAAGYSPLYKVGEKFAKAGKDWKKRKPVKLLYSNGNHYDLLTG